ncbi:MAG: amino acid adenylation domain-containing protein [Alteromonadaceae bacterium]|nr:amino acid adenylation domain-containing protein [Alteromonadaceae bacterium]
MDLKGFLLKCASIGIKFKVTNGELGIFSESGKVEEEIVNEIKNRKQDILNFITQYSNDSNESSLIKTDKDQAEVLSFQQRAIFLSDLVEGENSKYNIPALFHIAGKVDFEALQDSFRDVIEYSTSLRTVYFEHQNKWCQKITDKFHFELEHIDLSASQEALEKLNQKVERAAQKSFNLGSDLLINAFLAELPNGHSALFLNVHHMAVDGVSVNLILKYLSHFYAKRIGFDVTELNIPTVRYLDYALWQNEKTEETKTAEYLGYWKAHLAGIEADNSVPTAKIRPKIQSYQGCVLRQVLTSDKTTQIKGLCDHFDVSLFNMLYALFSVFIYRYSSRTDIVIGTPTASRTDEALQNVVGNFVNSLVLRQQVSATQPFSELVNNCRRELTDSFQHQELPFEELVESLRIRRDAAHHPIYQTMLSLQPEAQQTLVLPELDVTLQPLSNKSTKVDLYLNVSEVNGLLEFEWEYSLDLFSEQDIERLHESFEETISQVSACPIIEVGRISLLPQMQRRQVLDWSIGENVSIEGMSVFDLLQAHIVSTPHAQALISSEQSLTYRDLDSLIKINSQVLYHAKVKPGDRVMVAVEAGVSSVIAAWAIMRLGGTYVPIEVDAPIERYRQIAEDCEAKHLFIHPRFREQFTGLLPLKILHVDTEVAVTRSTDWLPSLSELGDLDAYIIYTSGSTGKPKGVPIGHRQLLHYVQAAKSLYNITADDTVMQFASLGFDASIEEIFVTLCSGARLLAKPKEVMESVESFWREVSLNKATVLALPTSFWHILCQDLEGYKAGTLKHKPRLCIIGGETAQSWHIKQWLNTTDIKLVNTYGPTEASVVATAQYLESSTNFGSIGRPLANYRCFVLNDSFSLQPVHAPGMLYIGGPAVAEGYLNDPEKSAQSFFKVDIESQTERVYKTGDIVRWLPDGSLEYLHRIDRQLKINGYRVDISEVETALLSYPGIIASYITLDDVSGRILAYVVADVESLSTNAVRDYISSILPRYMVPHDIIPLSTIPLNKNGKVDKTLLPKANGSCEIVEPQTALESQLRPLWAEVLGIDESKLSVRDDFFTLGGNSLKAVRLVSLIKETLSLPVATIQILEQGDIASLALLLSEAELNSEAGHQVKPDVVNRYQPFPLTEVQRAYWLGRSQDYILGNVGTHSYTELPIPTRHVEQFKAAWRKLIARHDMLRMVITENGQQRCLTNVPEYNFVEYKLQGEDPQNHFDELRESMSHHVFSGTEWPLFDVRVSELNQDQSLIHFSIDALIVDASSLMVLIKELGQLIVNPGQPLQEIGLTFRDYVISMKSATAESAYQLAREYWSEQVANFPGPPSLPLAVNPQDIDTPKFERRSRTFKQEQWQRLKKICGIHQLTPTCLMIDVLSEVLASWTQQKQFALNLTLFNRQDIHADVTSVVGDFTSLSLLDIDYRNQHENRITRLKKLQKKLWKNIEHSAFDGTEMQKLINQNRGEQLTYPVVVTSTLGLDSSDGALEDVLGIDSLIHGLFAITQTSQVWLDVKLIEADGNFYCDWDSVVGLFPEALLDLMFEAFWDQLEMIIDSPLQLENSERPSGIDKIASPYFAALNDTNKEIVPAPIHQAFLAQVEQQPEKIALINESVELTYRELNTVSDSVARLLIEAGGQPGSLVAVVMPKCWQQVAAVLAIVKAGGAYLPIDATLPAARIAELIRLGGVEQVVTVTQHLAELPTTLKIIEVSSSLPAMDFTPVEMPVDQIAYVIFTSGSTGKPKGVAISHKAAWNTIQDVQARFEIDSICIGYGLSSLSFDLSVFDIFGILGAGGTLVIPAQNALKEPAVWYQDIHTHKINFWNSVPALFQMLNDYVAFNKYPAVDSLTTVFMSGDWIPLDLFSKAQINAPEANLYSLGGATEAAIWSIYYPIQQVAPDWRSIPYGMPLSNQGFLVLSPQLELLPPWAEGDLYISGDGLAIEYWGDAEKTQKAFIHHPCKQQRLYKTGDRGRLNPEGYIEFLGRNDTQVKLQGYRIELGEIEYHIRSCDGVTDCCVHVCELAGGKILVAYIVGQSTDLDTIPAILQRTLPQYMIPMFYESLEQIPLTSNGKVDRSKLPLPAGVESQNNLTPSNLVEQTLLEVWRNSLGVEIEDVNSNFFHLGGDSIKAVALVTKIEKALSCTLSISELLAHATIRKLANHISARTNSRKALPQIKPDPARRFEPYPLTDVQQAYWVGRRKHFEMGNVGSHVYLEIPVKSFDVKRFESVWNTMIKRHDVLRMFVNERGMQQICEETPYYQIQCYDLSDHLQDRVAKHRHQLREELSHNLFSGEQWPLFDLRISHLPDDVSVLHYSMDELVLDASSTLLLFREMMQLMHDADWELPSHELAFRDYVMAHEGIIGSELYQHSKRYWVERLAALPEKPNLPLKVAVSDIKEPKFYRLASRMSKAQWDSLKQIAARYEVTPTVVVLGAFAEVLNRWVGSLHYVLNLTLYNRHPIHTEVNDILGDFTTLNLLEIDSRDLNSTLLTRFQNIQKQLWTDLEHRYFSGVEIQRELTTVKGQHAGYPIVVTSTLGLSGDEYDLAAMNEFDVGNDSEFEFGITQTPQTWIDVQYEEVRGGLYCNWDCVEGLFPDDMLEDMFTQFWSVLEILSEEAEAWQQECLDLMPENHLRVLEELNETLTTQPARLIHSDIVHKFATHADKVAVVSGERQLSYGQLDAYSSEIAFKLGQKKGGDKEQPLVAVLMEKSWHQIAAVLGILRAGFAYLPIDAHLPSARITKLLQLGKVQKVVTVSQFSESVPDGLELVFADELSGDIFEAPVSLSNIDDLAYVIFTSGSTGEPKGVAMTHQSVMNTIDDINQKYKLTDRDVCFGISSLSFDLSVYDIFGLLGVGGKVVLPGNHQNRDPQAWGEYIDEHDVTIWNSVPALAQMLAEHHHKQKRFDSLRVMLMSGDWIPLELPAMLNALCPAQLVSLGGATEAAIWSVYFNIDRVDPTWSSIPYGRPLANQSLYVLDSKLKPLPFWAEGDLYIGGEGLAQGYWQDEHKTALSFIEPPNIKQRLYRTGDRACLMPDGNFKFLGRKDSQVKLQGHRVELGEIESQLKLLTGIDNAVVSVQGQNLVAYLVLASGNELSIESVTEELRSALPEYMVPKHYMPIESLILTNNGKVDRNKLPKFIFESKAGDVTEPETEVEILLHGLWSTLLDVEIISTDSDFFELGGDSIAAIRLLAEVKKHFNTELASHEVFEKRTIQEQARLLSRIRTAKENREKAEDTSLDTLEW